jgi:hypothetical protein
MRTIAPSGTLSSSRIPRIASEAADVMASTSALLSCRGFAVATA